MKYSIILLLFVSLKGFGQLDTIKKPEKVLIRLGRPNTENNQPLFVVDGIFASKDEIQKLNPETIESVTVMKDSAASRFCNKQTNGVIIIKTKKYSKRELRKMKKKTRT